MAAILFRPQICQAETLWGCIERRFLWLKLKNARYHIRFIQSIKMFDNILLYFSFHTISLNNLTKLDSYAKAVNCQQFNCINTGGTKELP